MPTRYPDRSGTCLSTNIRSPDRVGYSKFVWICSPLLNKLGSTSCRNRKSQDTRLRNEILSRITNFKCQWMLIMVIAHEMEMWAWEMRAEKMSWEVSECVRQLSFNTSHVRISFFFLIKFKFFTIWVIGEGYDLKHRPLLYW